MNRFSCVYNIDIKWLFSKVHDIAQANCDVFLFCQDAFVALTQKYVDVPELTPTIVNEYIKKIEVFAPDKSSGKRVQHIHIKYDGIGFIPLNELLREETA